jgi:hypothetical protein
VHICTEIADIVDPEDDERLSKETLSRYNYWFSNDWYKDDSVHDLQLDASIKNKFEEIQEGEEWKSENENRIVKVRYGDLIRISQLLCQYAGFIEDEDLREELYGYAREIINLPETLKKPAITH